MYFKLNIQHLWKW